MDQLKNIRISLFISEQRNFSKRFKNILRMNLIWTFNFFFKGFKSCFEHDQVYGSRRSNTMSKRIGTTNEKYLCSIECTFKSKCCWFTRWRTYLWRNPNFRYVTLYVTLSIMFHVTCYNTCYVVCYIWFFILCYVIYIFFMLRSVALSLACFFFLHSYILTILSIMPSTVTSLISEHLISGQIYPIKSKVL